jgi:type IV secretory pathway VirB9-like protein
MNARAISKRRTLLRFLLGAILLGVFASSHVPVRAATETARVVKYGPNDIVPVKAKLRYSTLIVLPENEEILDFTTGDRDFWIIDGAHNLCYIRSPRLD